MSHKRKLATLQQQQHHSEDTPKKSKFSSSSSSEVPSITYHAKIIEQKDKLLSSENRDIWINYDFDKCVCGLCGVDLKLFDKDDKFRPRTYNYKIHLQGFHKDTKLSRSPQSPTSPSNNNNNSNNNNKQLIVASPSALITTSSKIGKKVSTQPLVDTRKETPNWEVELTPDETLQIHYKLTRYLCDSFQDFAVLQSDSFNSFLPRGYTLPEKDDITHKYMPALVARMEKNIKEEMKKINHLSLSTDYWVNIHSDKFLAITAHGLLETSDDLVPKQYLLSIEQVKDFPIENNVEQLIRKTLTKWELNGKVEYNLFDNAAVTFKSSCVQSLKSIKCSPYIFHFIFQEMFKPNNGGRVTTKSLQEDILLFHGGIDILDIKNQDTVVDDDIACIKPGVSQELLLSLSISSLTKWMKLNDLNQKSAGPTKVDMVKVILEKLKQHGPHGSTERDSFRKLRYLNKKTHKLVKFIKDNELEQKLYNLLIKNGMDEHPLLKEASLSKWGSFYLHFSAVEDTYTYIKDMLSGYIKMEGYKEYLLDEEDLKFLHDVVQIFKVFEDISAVIYLNESIPTIAMMTFAMHYFQTKLKQESTKILKTATGVQLCRDILTEFDQKYPYFFEAPEHELNIIPFLDPRFVLHDSYKANVSLALDYFKQMIQKMMEPDNQAINIDELIPHLHMDLKDMYKEPHSVELKNYISLCIKFVGSFGKPDRSKGDDIHSSTVSDEILNYDILQWWFQNKSTFPYLYSLVLKYLCIPGSASYTEDILFKYGILYARNRSNLPTSHTLSMMMIHINSEFT
ncbi:actin binding protein [Tieghemostelium lacteum]|uniref:Actin binding protein n=1 Tax=Tieghemostelium lacteum TaxID=361077 RepID=A0A152A7J9_TIELA|nr:actin binding protein [Tieghemostelium lacteum]|eukprot:KYR02105.1 actin binding protein [Tieghemostelium lacteum]